MKGSNTGKFIEKAIKIHGEKYDYSKVDYKKSNIHITIICKKHGEFSQTPNKHIMNRGCPKCGKISSMMSQRKTKEQFITDAIEKHGNRYDYSKVNYINSQTNVDIICKIHGQFSQLANNHLNGEGCYKCGRISCGQKQTKLHETFITESKEIHGEKYE